MPKGAKPAGIAGSENDWTCVKVMSKTSTVAKRKLVAYRRVPADSESIASPLQTAPTSPALSTTLELSTTITPRVALTVGLQATMVPSSVAKMNRLGPDCPNLETTKPLEPLKTVPVGAPPGRLPGLGISITGGADWAAPLRMLYCVLTPAVIVRDPDRAGWC